MTDTFDPRSIAWVLTDDDVDHLIMRIEEAGEVSYDLETTGLNEHATTAKGNKGVAARVSMASYTFPDDTSYVLPLSHPEGPWQNKWRRIFRQVSEALQGRRLVGQNIKFDCRWTYAHTRVDLSDDVYWDTQIASHLLDENTPTKLKVRAPEVFNIPPWDDHDLSYPGASEDVPLFDLGVYAARDTYWTRRLALYQQEQMFIGADVPPMFPDEIEGARLGQLMMNAAMPSVRMLTKLEQRGIGLDEQRVRDEIENYEHILQKKSAELAGKYGAYRPEDVSWAPTSHWFRNWTEQAVDAGDLQIISMTARGNPQWTKEVLEKLDRMGYKTAAELRVLRDASKKLEFLRSWLYDSHEGRIYSTYNAGSVVTGRLSSSGPNMQQVTKALRPCFVPSPGHVLIDLDYSQIEMRVAAFISRSEPLIQAFKDGLDTHSIIAARIIEEGQQELKENLEKVGRGEEAGPVGYGIEDVTPAQRQSGKAANFGLIYGMGAYGFKRYAESAYGVEMSEEGARRAHKAFFDTWKGLTEWHIAQKRYAYDHGKVVSPIGRVRRLPAIWSGDEQRQQDAERVAINAPVQGFASDLMQMAAASIEGTVDGVPPVEGAALVGTVHDSIVVEAPADDWRRVRDECIERMEQVPQIIWDKFMVRFDVPLKADAEAGTRWSAGDL